MPLTPRSAMPASRERWLLTTVLVLLTMGWSWHAGNDLSWDVINHHLYQPFSLLSGRYVGDLFAASYQSYFNPLGYVPAYLLITHPLPSWVVGLSLTALHAAAAWPLVNLVMRLWPGAGHADRTSRCLALGLAWVAPIFLLTIGTSSGDPWSTLLVLWSLALVVGGQSALKPWAYAGLLMGAATGLKLSNAIYAVALALMLLLLLLKKHDRPAHLLAYGATAVLAFTATNGFWAWHLWTTFANPLYPMFNAWFQSPYAPLEQMVDLRFVPASLGDGLLRPLLWAQYRAYTHTEAFAPDTRPLLVLVFSAAAGVMTAWRRRDRRAPLAHRTSGVAFELSAFTAIAFALWLTSSGNSRYAIVLFVLAGPLLVLAVEAVIAASAARAVLGVVLAVQLFVFATDSELRYTPKAWDAHPLLEVKVPARLKDAPFLHLSLGTPSFAGIAPFLHPAGRFVNFMGPMSLPTEGPLGDMLKQRLQQWSGRTRILMAAPRDWRGQVPNPTFSARADRIIYRSGLQFDWADCEEVQIVHGSAAHTAADPSSGVTRLISCATKAREADDANYDSDLAYANRAFDVLERQCPHIFGPSPMATDGDLDAWQRRYMNTSARATVSFNDGVGISHFRSDRYVVLGSVDDVIAGKGKPACVAWDELGVD